jgi:hypothetical protein
LAPPWWIKKVFLSVSIATISNFYEGIIMKHLNQKSVSVGEPLLALSGSPSLMSLDWCLSD